MPKSFESMRNQVAKQLEKINLENILGAIGLRLIERGGRGMTLPVLAGFGAGLAVGAGVGLLFAPMTGRDLRQKIGAMLSKSTRDSDVEAPSEEATKPARSLVTSPTNHAKSGRPSDANTAS